MKISFQAFGDEAMLINFEQKIDEVINEQVHLLTRSIELLNIPSIKYITPAYCSITIAYNTEKINFTLLKNQIKEIASERRDKLKSLNRKLFIPVCYDRSFALDLEDIINQTGLSASEIVEKHTSVTFKTYMIGFLPGFPYLGRLPNEMNCIRKPDPRLKVPKGAVGLAGLQTGIYPNVSPGGWQILGNTPIALTSSDKKQPFLFRAGDEVKFYSISKSKHRAIIKEQAHGDFNWSSVYE